MGRLVVLGEAVRVEGFALAGATVLVADDTDAVRRAWASLPGDVAVVLLTANAAAALAEEPALREGVLSAVMPL
jgi:vacuolar-type H+-ATPase subunit F/Vma7